MSAPATAPAVAWGSRATVGPARVDLAAVHDARRRLAAIAAGDGLLLHTDDLGRRPGDAAGLLRRAVEARLMLLYASGRPVTHVDSPGRPDAGHLLGDAAATHPPAPPATVVEGLFVALRASPVRDSLLAPLWRAAKFAEAHRMFPAPGPEPAPLVCAAPGGADRPVPGDEFRCYDPAAHVLRLDPAGSYGARAGRWVNPLMVDVTGEDRGRLPELCERLDPEREPGRLVLRLHGPTELTGPLLAVAAATLRRVGHPVVWLVAADGGRVERLAPLVAGAATGVCLGGPGHDDDGRGGWLRDRSARLAAALLS